MMRDEKNVCLTAQGHPEWRNTAVFLLFVCIKSWALHLMEFLSSTKFSKCVHVIPRAVLYVWVKLRI
jgi:hypothetical protein